MTSRSTLLAAALAVVLLASAGPTPALPGPPQRGFGGEIVPGEVLVKFRATASAQRRQAALASLGHAPLASLGAGGWVHARTAPGQTVAEALAAYAENADVEYAQPNFVYRASAVPNDTLYPYLWGLRNTGQDMTGAPSEPAGGPLHGITSGTAGDDMRLEPAWSAITDCSSVTVAVVDSGVNYLHQDLAGNMWAGGAANPHHGKNFVDAVAGGDDATLDLNGHGTHVAGTIGAFGNNGMGATGVCWKASIMAIRVLDASGSGTTAGIIQGIDFAVTNGAKVINMSLGGGGFDSLFEEAITAAQLSDVVVVVAAGNDGKNNDVAGNAVYPCNFTAANLLCVAALDQSYQLADFTNWGATSVDVGAPGTNIVSTWPGPMVGDPLTSGWNFTTTTAGGWHYFAQTNLEALMDGSPSGTYRNSTDDRAWKAFNLTGFGDAMLHFYTVVDLASGDGVGVAWASTASDPFASGTFAGAINGPVSTWPNFVAAAVDVSGCVGASCAIGFQLLSNAAPQSSHGVVLAGFAIGTSPANAASYNTESGTSMASPAVAGVAAMLRAYNPQFTHADVVVAIEGGGRSLSVLFGKTTTGRAVDAMGALAFIQAPTGLAYAVH